MFVPAGLKLILTLHPSKHALVDILKHGTWEHIYGEREIVLAQSFLFIENTQNNRG